MYRLRELEKRDIKEINMWRNDSELISLLGAPFRYINVEVDERWFEGYMSNRSTTVRCSITDETDNCLGIVSLTNIDYLNQRAVFHIMIGNKENQGRGIGTFATTEMLRHAFLNLNLNRVELTVLDSNIRARHVYEKIGFVREGIKRKCVYKEGRFINTIMYSILKEEFMKKSPV